MIEAFAHDATLLMPPEADLGAPGAAVTLALCGSWDHDPPCPLAPHHSDVERADSSRVKVRVLFAAEPSREAEVRRRIESALTSGSLRGPGGVITLWELLTSRPGVVQARETQLAQHLASGPTAG